MKLSLEDLVSHLDDCLGEYDLGSDPVRVFTDDGVLLGFVEYINVDEMGVYLEMEKKV